MSEPAQTYEAAAARVEEIIRRLDSGEACLERDARAGEGGKVADRAVRAGARGGRRCPRGAATRRAGRPPGRARLPREHLGAAGRAARADRRLLARAPAATVSSEFERKSTVIHLRGAEEEGAGEDVTYDAVDHDILQAAGPVLPLAGRFTLGSFAEHLAGLSLFAEPPAAGGLTALPHVGIRVGRPRPGAAPGAHHAARRAQREPQPVRFVVSLRLGEPPSLEPVRRRLALLPLAALQARPHELLG